MKSIKPKNTLRKRFIAAKADSLVILTIPGQVLILYGAWKFGRNLGLTFQMDYGQGKVKSMVFGAEVTFGRDKFIFALKNEFGEPLGITLTMTHKFLKSFDAEAFINYVDCL